MWLIMVRFSHQGNFEKTDKFLENIKRMRIQNQLNKYAELGVRALSEATPKDSGATASSWGYEIEYGSERVVITWINSNVNKGVNIAVIIQHGHGTRNGGYVKGRDYINPAMRPVFDEISEKVWKEVTS